MDDDPCVVEAAASAQWPWEFFLDRETLSYAASLTPFQLVSLWADHRAFGLDPQPFYLHHALSVTTCLVLVWLAARDLTGDRGLAWLVGLAWLLSASTLSAASFLSVRHYVDGLTLSLVAAVLLARLPPRPWGRSERVRFGLALVAALTACLHKEIFLVLLVPPLVAVAARQGWRLVLLVALGCVAYAAYRTWALGLAPAYPVPLLPPGEALRALAQLPRALDAHALGYVFALAAAALPLVLALRRHWRAASLAAIVLVGQVVVLYPVAHVLKSGALATPGTWYRVALVPLTLALLFAARLLVELGVAPLVRRAAFAVAVALLAAQAGSTAAAWHRFERHHAAELAFVLGDTPGVLVSTVPAGWYLECAARIYEAPRERFAFVADGPGLCGKTPTAWVWVGTALRSFDPCR